MTLVALIFGGRSPEHEVSIVSARNVNQQLKEAGYNVLPVGIDRQGRWHAGDDAFNTLCNEPTAQTATGMAQVLSRTDLDVVFPMVHGVTGEDGSIQGLCKLLGLPWVGGDALNQSLCWDKLATRTLLHHNRLPQPAFLGFFRNRYDEDNAIRKIESKLHYPVFVKPSRTGSSIGVSKASGRSQLRDAINLAFEYDYRIIVEQGLDGQEIEIAGLGALEPELSIPAEIIPGGEFYDFKEKYLDSGTRFVIPAEMKPAQLEEMKGIAQQAWSILNCYGLSRIDFMVTRDGVYLNEVNTIPGFTSISMYPSLMNKSGVSSTQLMKRLIDLALQRDQLLGVKDHFETQDDWYKGKKDD